MTVLSRCMALFLLATVMVLPLAGCGEKPGDAPTPPATNPAAGGPQTGGGGARTDATAATVTDGKQDLKEAVCVVCAADGKPHGPEPVKASIEYKGKGYYFCDEAEKAEFISNPARYAVAGK